MVVSGSLLKNQRDNVRRVLQAMTEGIYVFKTKPDVAMSLLKESNSDPQVVKPLYERLNKAMLEYPVPESKGTFKQLWILCFRPKHAALARKILRIRA